MALSINTVKEYLRVDYDDEDTTINNLITTANSYIKRSTGKTKINDTAIDDDEVFCQLQQLLVAHWFENRSAVSDKQVYKVPLSADVMLEHIKMSVKYD